MTTLAVRCPLIGPHAPVRGPGAMRPGHGTEFAPSSFAHHAKGPNMLQSIMVPLDRSSFAEQAIPLALSLAELETISIMGR